MTPASYLNFLELKTQRFFLSPTTPIHLELTFPHVQVLDYTSTTSKLLFIAFSPTTTRYMCTVTQSLVLFVPEEQALGLVLARLFVSQTVDSHDRCVPPTV